MRAGAREVMVVALLVGCAGAPPAGATPEPEPTPELEPEPVAAPAPAAAPSPGELVDITSLDDTIALDIRYATENNFANARVYPIARCLLRAEVAERLVRVHRALRAEGYGLKIWDCYRPISVQQRFWELVPDARYVARPSFDRDGTPIGGSKHNRGAAVDLTLVTIGGADVEMPTDYDDFTERAHRGHAGASAAARRNSTLLEEAMEAEGFTGLATEWWHFDGPGWRQYELSDEPLTR